METPVLSNNAYWLGGHKLKYATVLCAVEHNPDCDMNEPVAKVHVQVNEQYRVQPSIKLLTDGSIYRIELQFAHRHVPDTKS